MAIKTTIDSRGVVTETIAGSNDVLVIASNQRSVAQGTVSAGDVSGTVAIVSPFHVLNPGASGLVTGSLPTIGADEVGLRLLVLTDQTTGVVVLSGATGQKVVSEGTTLAGATLEWKLTGPTAFADVVATVSGSGTYYWAVLAGSGSY